MSSEQGDVNRIGSSQVHSTDFPTVTIQYLKAMQAARKAQQAQDTSAIIIVMSWYCP